MIIEVTNEDLKWLFALAFEFTETKMMDPFYAMDTMDEIKLIRLKKKYIGDGS